MFYISNIQGGQSLYSPGTTQVKNTEAVASVEKISPSGSRSEQLVGSPNFGSNQRTGSPSQNPYAKLDNNRDIPTRAILVSQIMTAPVISLGINDIVESAWKLFRERRFRHVPILSKEGRLVGMISDRDFLTLGLDHEGRGLTKEQQLATPLSVLMGSDVLTARPSTEIRLMAKVMFDERITAMPVVDEKEDLVGIVTTNDILRTIVQNAPLELWI